MPGGDETTPNEVVAWAPMDAPALTPRTRRPTRVVACFLVAAAGALVTACGAQRNEVGGEGLTGTDGGDASGFEPDSSDTTDPGPGDGAGFDLGPGGDGAPPSDDSSCAATSSTATLIPLDLFIMLDQSGSMKETTSTGVTKWDAVKSAFKTFIADPGSAGLGVGIQYFGLPTSGSWLPSLGSSCNVADYAKAEVEIAPLPGVGAAINTSLNAHSPSTDTPTAPALQGAIQHAQAWQAAHPTHVVVVVFGTDGLPSACKPTDIPSIAAFAATAYAGKPPIRTYVIGVLSDKDLAAGADANLNQISKAGNGADAFIVKTAADVTATFIAALKKIRGTALACEYEVPTGAGADYKKVNVSVTLGGKSSIIPYVGDKSKCDPVKGGWYYDIDPSLGKPKKILMCDATCKALQSDSTGKIDIQVGCATIGPK